MPVMHHDQTIEQLGGFGRLRAFVGAYCFTKSENALNFRFKGSRRANYISIELTVMDTYRVKFWKLKRYNALEVSEHEDIYAEDLVPLFQRETGLVLSL